MFVPRSLHADKMNAGWMQVPSLAASAKISECLDLLVHAFSEIKRRELRWHLEQSFLVLISVIGITRRHYSSVVMCLPQYTELKWSISYSTKLKSAQNDFKKYKCYINALRSRTRTNSERFPKQSPMSVMCDDVIFNRLKSAFLDSWVIHIGYWSVPFCSDENWRIIVS